MLVWVFCNFALGAVVLSAAGLERVNDQDPEKADNERATIYMAVVLWSVAGLSIFRFIGAMWFLIVRMVSPVSAVPVLRTMLTSVYSSGAFEIEYGYMVFPLSSNSGSVLYEYSRRVVGMARCDMINGYLRCLTMIRESDPSRCLCAFYTWFWLFPFFYLVFTGRWKGRGGKKE